VIKDFELPILARRFPAHPLALSANLTLQICDRPITVQSTRDTWVPPAAGQEWFLTIFQSLDLFMKGNISANDFPSDLESGQ
jgi:hypothetical protein